MVIIHDEAMSWQEFFKVQMIRQMILRNLGKNAENREPWLPVCELSLYLEQPDTGIGTGFHGIVIPDAGLDFTDVGAAHHEHAQARLANTAADGQG